MNNDFAIESFIDYCDDMMIANEAINLKHIGKVVWDKIRTMFKNISRWFKNLLLNINYFKNALLSAKMNADILTVMKMAQARTEKFFNILPELYKEMSRKTTIDNETKIEGYKVGVIGPTKEIRATTFNDQVHRLSTDIVNNIDAAKKSDAYKRLINNEYTDEVKQIPLTNIIPDMKNCQANLNKMEDQITKFQNIQIDEKNTEAAKTINQLKVFMGHVIEYYNFRISILSKYFKAAKASLLGIRNNLKESSAVNNRTTTSFRAKKTFNVKVASEEMKDKIKQLYKDAMAAETYREYKPIYDEIVKLLKIKPYTIRRLDFSAPLTIGVTVIEESNSEIPLAKGQRLYHTSPNRFEVEAIKPAWTASHGALYPNPRVYFHTTIPLDRHGNRADSEFGGNVYEIASPPDKIYADRELGLTAIYVVSEKPVPVKRVDYKEWKRINDINLGIEKE